MQFNNVPSKCVKLNCRVFNESALTRLSLVPALRTYSLYRASQYTEDRNIARHFIVPASDLGVSEIIERLQAFDPSDHMRELFAEGSDVTLYELVAFTLIVRNIIEDDRM